MRFVMSCLYLLYGYSAVGPVRFGLILPPGPVGGVLTHLGRGVWMNSGVFISGEIISFFFTQHHLYLVYLLVLLTIRLEEIIFTPLLVRCLVRRHPSSSYVARFMCFGTLHSPSSV